jgi:hypothetical protein
MATKGKGANRVRVACKLPHGLNIKLADGERVILKGRLAPGAMYGHGFTYVDARQWAAVELQYGPDSDRPAKWFTKEHVFAMPDPDSVADKAKDRERVNAGFDPLDMSQPRSFGTVTIATAEGGNLQGNDPTR